nr:hypothetical protein [Deltaproteobacteria bacterium]
MDDEHLHLEGFNAALRPAGRRHLARQATARQYLGFDDRGAFARDAPRPQARPATSASPRSSPPRASCTPSSPPALLTVFEGAGAAEVRRRAGPVAIVSGALRPEIDVALRLMGAESAPG